jgi:hypothetical protein
VFFFRRSGFLRGGAKPGGGKAAPAAEGLLGTAVQKAPGKCLCAGGGEDLLQFLPEKVAQGDAAVVVQTAGYHRAVAQDTQLIPQSPAKDPSFGGGSGQIRPCKAILIVEEHPVGKTEAVPLGCPRPWEMPLQKGEDFPVSIGLHAAVPKAKDHRYPLTQQLTSGAAALHILGEGQGDIVGLQSVEGDVELTQGGCGEEKGYLSGEGDTVGGE